MDSHQSTSDDSLKSLHSPSPQHSESLLNSEVLSGLPTCIVDEVTVTTETCLSAIISSSLQVVGGTLLEDDEDRCGDPGECKHSEAGDACNTVEEDKTTTSPEQSRSSDVVLGEDDLMNVARSTDNETDKWRRLLHRKRACSEGSVSCLQTELPLSPPLQSSSVHSTVMSSQARSVSTSDEQFLASTQAQAPTSSQGPTLTHLPQPTNSNNSNSCEGNVISPSILPSATAALSIGELPRKRAKIVKHGQIEVILEGKNLWDEFYRRGTEMIVNRLGRRMFPGFAVAVSGLKPKAKYTMKVEVILADNHRFKFLNGRWLAVGNAEPQPLSETYIHPDSPNTGAFWMRHGVSFRKLKVTNNKEKPGNNALIYSMHKYYLRLIIDEEFKAPAGQKIPPKNVLQMDFPETSFIAVTAYQNEEVTQLKITNNPFAKAFRENAAEMDWDMMYQHNGMSPSLHPDMYGNHPHMMQGGMWPAHSPMLPPTPLTSTLPPYSPLTGISPNQGVMSYQQHYQYPSNITPTAFPGATSSVPGAGGYFQWPQIGGQHRNTAAGSATTQAIVTPVSSAPLLTHRDPSYNQFSVPYSGAPIHPPSSHLLTHSTLPDFDSAFTASIGHN